MQSVIAFSHWRQKIVSFRPQQLSRYAIDCALNYRSQIEWCLVIKPFSLCLILAAPWLIITPLLQTKERRSMWLIEVCLVPRPCWRHFSNETSREAKPFYLELCVLPSSQCQWQRFDEAICCFVGLLAIHLKQKDEGKRRPLPARLRTLMIIASLRTADTWGSISQSGFLDRFSVAFLINSIRISVSLALDIRTTSQFLCFSYFLINTAG